MDVPTTALRVFRRLPRPVRRHLVRTGKTTYTVGCLAVVTDGDEVLLLRQSHLPGLSLPGGLLERGETPAECVRREAREELGVDVDVAEHPDGVVVDGHARRVDMVFLVQQRVEPRLADGGEVQEALWRTPDAVSPGSPTGRALAAVLSAAGER